MRGIITILALLLLTGLPRLVQAQTMTCSETLMEAQNRFQQGDFYSISSLLKSCLDNGFNKQQRIEAYWLLTQTYLFLDDPIAAEDSYMKLLRIDPTYEVNKELDPVDVVYLSNKFTTRPVITLSGAIGSNMTTARVIEPFSLSQVQGDPSYSSGIGFQAGFGVDFTLTDHINVGTELNILTRKYTYQRSLFNIDAQQLTENQVNIDIPLIFRYNFFMKKVNPYLYWGISGQYLISAGANATLDDRFISNEEVGLSEFTVQGPTVDIMGQRKKMTHSLIIGAGLMLPIGYNYLKLDVRLMQGLNNVVDPSGHYTNQELMYRYAYIDDYKYLNNYLFSVGFVKPLYKPRKIKKYRK